MKKSIGSQSRYIGISLLFTVLFISNSCNKSSYNNMTGISNNPYGSGTPGSGMNEIVIQGMTFSPSAITITPNTTITWTNKDAIGHTVTSDSGLFDSGTIATNGTYSYTFKTSGTFMYHCKVHPTMTASVTVSGSADPGTTPGTMPGTMPGMTPGY
jgi:VCBS repeat-containing protein